MPNIVTLPIVSPKMIERRILFIRGEKVLLDSDLADLYGVETRSLVQAVKRNLERFPKDFMFQLSAKEYANLRSQIVISSLSYGGRRYLPYVFTEHGALMLANVLRNKKAIQVSIEIVRAFVQLRQALSTNKDLARKLQELEQKYNKKFKVVFDAIYALMKPSQPEPKRGRIGFNTTKEDIAIGKLAQERMKKHKGRWLSHKEVWGK